MEPVVARLVSRNEHKLRELRRALPGWEMELIEAWVELPPEVGESYYENARAKASFGHSVGEPGLWILGEDSGLEVEALGGAPGLRSARWAGRDHVERVLEALEGVEARRARYVAELVALSPSGDEVRGTGILEGAIAKEPSGSAGFGFDPVFIPEGEEQTVAELGDEWKAEHSHRARAAQALRAAVESR